MRNLLISLLFILFATSTHLAVASSVHEYSPYIFKISKDVYKFSEAYQITPVQKSTYPGSVNKSSFRIRTNYDLYDKNGWQATGITRIVSLGAMYAWGKDIDIYDNSGAQIAFIDGDAATFESAKFNLYEYDDAGNQKLIGIAYANKEFNRFTIFPSIEDPHPIAEMNRDFSDKTWTVSVHYPEKIDDRILRIFASFVVDYQDKFLAKPSNISNI